MQLQIWLVGGTTESVDLAHAIVQCQLPCIVTVISNAARDLYPQSPGLQVYSEALSVSMIEPFIQDHQIGVILDASHPYATEISHLAMRAATHFQLPYLRFERPPAPTKVSTKNPWIVEVDTVSQLLQTQDVQQQRVLLTIGSRWLPQFADWHRNNTLFVRLLPQQAALQAAVQAGFSCDRIIALRPPISLELEKALWQQWQITVVVTKASGQPGGEHIKRQVAQALGVTLIVIKRPALAYPQQTNDVQTAIHFCQTALDQTKG